MYIVGKKSDKTVIETSGIYHTGNPPVSAILGNVIKKYGGNESDYSVYFVPDNASQEKILHGAWYDVIWTGFNTTAKITAVDFARDFSRKKIKVTADNTLVMMGENVTFTGEVLNNDGTLDTKYDGTNIVTIGTPDGTLRIRVHFNNGKCIHVFTPSRYGFYSIPYNTVYEEDFKVDTQLVFEVAYDAVNELDT